MSKETLQALSQVNREWNKMIVSLLYEHLIVRLNEEIINIWLCLPYPRFVLTHVKRLTIVAERRASPAVSSPELRAKLSRGIHNEFKRFPRDLQQAKLGDTFIPVAGDYSRGDWTPILNLIRQIPSLHNFNHFVRKGGPVEPCEAISRYHPTCRVSISSLGLTLAGIPQIRTFKRHGFFHQFYMPYMLALPRTQIAGNLLNIPIGSFRASYYLRLISRRLPYRLAQIVTGAMKRALMNESK